MFRHVLRAAIGLVAAVSSAPSWAAAVSGQGTWETTLLPRYFDGDATPDGYYDTDLGITWLANANVGGGMTWANANTWAGGLSYSGSWGIANDWRLPETDPINGSAYNYSLSNNGSTDVGFNVSAPGTAYGGSSGSEMAHLFYNTLGNLSPCNPVTSTAGSCVGQGGWGLTNTGPFSNLQSLNYWSGSAYAPDSSRAWYFSFNFGYQYPLNTVSGFSAWAVHPGDVGAATPVPVPAAAWLLGSGLLGLAGVARRRRLLQ